MRALRDRGLRTAGLDLSLGQLRTSQLPAVAVADMRRLPLQTATVDGVWCQAAFLHVPRADAPGVLGEFHRVLRPGGFLFLNTAEGSREGWETDRYGEEHPRYFIYHRQDNLVAMVAAAGFEVLKVKIEASGRRWVSVRAWSADPRDR